ncbi:MAG: protein-glutamate O-methyltransferase CheR [Pseudomonadota bacterium]
MNSNDAKQTPSALPDLELFMRISDQEFQNIRSLVYDRFGINLTDQKRGLVVGRLQRLLHTQGFKNFGDYYQYLTADKTGQALVDLINRISTNYTYFYRENAHFDFFSQTVMPWIVEDLKAGNRRDVRVWSAGCSTGQEPYGLTMLLMEYFGPEYGTWDAGVLATDISANALQQAAAGVYPEDQVSMLPKNLASKYFSPSGSGRLAVIPRVKQEVTFRIFNLMTKSFPFKKKFHAIFCRNVMIYFDAPTRAELVRKFFEFTTPGGYLFIGHSESLGRQDSMFRYIMPAVYRKI